GVGLFDREAVAASDRVEQLVEAEAFDHRDRRPLRLIRADRGTVAASAQRRQRLRHVGVGAGQPYRVRLVDLEEARQCAPRLGRIGAARRQSARDHGRRTAPDYVFHLSQRQRGMARSRSIWFSAARKSGALSTSVPSRSKMSKNRFITANSALSCYALQ